MIVISEGLVNFVSSKEKYAKLYANSVSDFVQKTFRKEYFRLDKQKGKPQKENGVYIPINYARLLSTIYADYEIGDGVLFDYGDEAVNTQVGVAVSQNEINKVLYNVTQKKSALGYGVCLVSKNEDGSIKVSSIPTTNYFPDTNGLQIGDTIYDIKNHYIVSNVQESGTRYSYVNSFLKTDDGKWTNKCEKYKYTPQKTGGFSFKDPIESTEQTLDYLPLFVFNNNLLNDEDFDFTESNPYTYTQQYYNCSVLGQSDYADLIDIMLEINDRTTQISIENYKHLGSKISFPASTVENYKKELQRQIALQRQSGSITAQEAMDLESSQILQPNFERYTHQQGEQPAQYIQKDNAHLEYAKDQLNDMIRKISAITRIPVQFFGLEESSGNVKVGTMNNQLDSFYQKIESKRTASRATLYRMFAYIGFLLNGNYKVPTIEFKKLSTHDFTLLSDAISTAKSIGIISQKTAVSKLLDIEGMALEDELATIQQDSQITNAIQPNLPTLT